MEKLIENKRFIKYTTILMGLLCVFVIFKIIHLIKNDGGKFGQPQNVISVSADAFVTAVPDIAVLSVNIEKEGKTAKEANDLVNDFTKKVLAYLKTQNIDDKDVKVEYGGVSPKYQNSPVYCVTVPCPGEIKITGYIANQSINIKIRDVDNANVIRTGLADLGITNISGPTFSIDDEEVLMAEARGKAIEEARSKAKLLAKQLHVRLGKVVNFSENSGGYPMPMYKSMEMAVDSSMAGNAPVLPKGENKITAYVTITYEIK